MGAAPTSGKEQESGSCVTPTENSSTNAWNLNLSNGNQNNNNKSTNQNRVRAVSASNSGNLFLNGNK